MSEIENADFGIVIQEPTSLLNPVPTRESLRELVLKEVLNGEMSIRKGAEALNMSYRDFYESLPEEYFLEVDEETGKATV